MTITCVPCLIMCVLLSGGCAFDGHLPPGPTAPSTPVPAPPPSPSPPPVVPPLVTPPAVPPLVTPPAVPPLVTPPAVPPAVPAPPVIVNPPPSAPPIVILPPPVPLDLRLLWELVNENGLLLVRLGFSVQGAVNGATSVTYSFGDGTPSVTILRSWTHTLTTTHQYRPGTWEAGVSVTDGAGRTATDHELVRVPPW